MNKEEIDELIEYNLEYLEARNSEDIFGGDYTSSVDLKYANKEIEQLQQELNQKNKIIEETIDYVKYLKKNMGIDEYYLEKIYTEKYIDKILSKLEKGSKE